jgi:hypothetical protein
MILVVYFSHIEFHKIQETILRKIIKDYYAEITWKTLMSFPLTTFIFMICPTILYLFDDKEIFAFIIPIVILEINRIHNFILIHRILNTKEIKLSEINYKVTTEKEKFNIEKMPNPVLTALKKDHYEEKITNEAGNENGLLKKLLGVNSHSALKSLNDVTTKKEKHEKNKPNETVSASMFNCCLLIIMLDLIFFSIYIYPVCLGISIHKKSQNGFLYVLSIVIIAFQCDNGALLFGKLFGKNPFGHPVTPSKTKEGIYGGIFLGLTSSYFYRYLLKELFEINYMTNDVSFFLYSTLCVAMALIGDFFESFLKRCAEIKDSGNLLPGHGGLLDRIDSMTLCVPICLYFCM